MISGCCACKIRCNCKEMASVEWCQQCVQWYQQCVSSYNVSQKNCILRTDRNSPYLLTDGPSLEEGPKRKRKTRNTVVEPVKERYFADLNLPTAFAGRALPWLGIDCLAALRYCRDEL